MKTNSVPKIRFKGFTDDWERRKFPEFVEFYNGLTYSPDDVRASGTLVLRSSNVKNGEIVDADNVYVEPDKATSENVKEGDIIVVVRNGSRALIGKHAEIKESMSNTVIGAFMSGIRSEHSSFVNALLDTNQFEKEIEKNMGATINQITGYMFSKMEFTIPSPTEQDKIGNYFKYLDHLITLHQRKCEQTKELKKFMLQKMFPKKGEKNPEIRFPGFTDDWEQRKLGEVANYRNGKAHENDIDDAGDYIVINSKFVSTDGEVKKYSNVQNEPLYEGEIAFVLSDVPNGRAIARTFLVDKSGKYTLNQRIAGITPHENTDAYYLHIKLNRNAYFLKFDDGNKQTNLSIKDVLNYEDYYPCYEEQKKIGDYFKSLDRLITLHQRKCEQLKELKKFMLQNMFPKKG
ncbi:restriction endonuclease subunit S [Streptococcus infantarius]|uniref:restriction endonuclease subunit S n=1 Tax=Streptococcus infantarius TaxID=102684 RepID=UPI003C1B7E5F